MNALKTKHLIKLKYKMTLFHQFHEGRKISEKVVDTKTTKHNELDRKIDDILTSRALEPNNVSPLGLVFWLTTGGHHPRICWQGILLYGKSYCIYFMELEHRMAKNYWF